MHPNTSRALVTGASSGLGAGLAQRFAARGCEVWLVARREDLLQAQVRAIRASGGRAHALALDLGDLDASVERLARLDRETGGMDLVIAAAGIAGARAGIPLSRARWQDTSEILRVNLGGALGSFVPFVPGMLQRGYGQLVAISSIAAAFPNARMPVYGAAKAGLSFVGQSLDMELRRRGVPVTVVEPGFVSTPAIEGIHAPMPFLLRTEVALDQIERGILRRQRLVRFPRRLTMLLRAYALLPPALAELLARRLPAERVQPGPRCTRGAGDRECVVRAGQDA